MFLRLLVLRVGLPNRVLLQAPGFESCRANPVPLQTPSFGPVKGWPLSAPGHAIAYTGCATSQVGALLWEEMDPAR